MIKRLGLYGLEGYRRTLHIKKNELPATRDEFTHLMKLKEYQ
jgi:hypothetical protein